MESRTRRRVVFVAVVVIAIVRKSMVLV